MEKLIPDRVYQELTRRSARGELLAAHYLLLLVASAHALLAMRTQEASWEEGVVVALDRLADAVNRILPSGIREFAPYLASDEGKGAASNSDPLQAACTATIEAIPLAHDCVPDRLEEELIAGLDRLAVAIHQVLPNGLWEFSRYMSSAWASAGQPASTQDIERRAEHLRTRKQGGNAR